MLRRRAGAPRPPRHVASDSVIPNGFQYRRREDRADRQAPGRPPAMMMMAWTMMMMMMMMMMIDQWNEHEHCVRRLRARGRRGCAATAPPRTLHMNS